MIARYIAFGLIALLVLGGCARARHAAQSLSHCKSPDILDSWNRIAHEVPDPGEAARLIDAALCVPESEGAESYLRSRLAPEVTVTAYGTGDPEESREVLEAAKVVRVPVFAESPEWRYYVLLIDGQILISAENEACIWDITIEHAKAAGWRIIHIGDACD